jgi:hypothetical protein
VTKFPIKLPAVLSLAALSFAFLVLFGLLTEAWAACETSKCVTGWNNCQAWCEANNTSLKKRGICAARCDRYWQDGASKVSNPTNPSGPPNKGVGPVKLKNPPTTVSNPNSPQPPLQIQERRKK